MDVKIYSALKRNAKGQNGGNDMKKWKRTTGLVLSAVLAAGLCACGNGGQNAGKSSVPFNQTGYPIVNDKVTIKVMAPNWGNVKDFNELADVKEYEELTNVHVDWQYFTGDASEKLSLAFAAKNNIPDLFLMADMSSSTVDKYGEDGVLMAVEDLISQYAPNVQKAIEEDVDGRKMATAANGHMYAIPSLFRSPMEKIRGISFINEEWLEKLNLHMPSTTDELYRTLAAFKEQDPNGNGEADEVPLTLYWDNNTSGVASLFGAWGVSSAYTGAGGSCMSGPFFVKNKKVVVSNMQDEYKEAVKFFHQLYSEGLMNIDAFTGDKKSIAARIKAEPYTAGMFNDWDGTIAGPFAKSSQTYTAMSPLKGPKGEQNMFKPVYGVFANNYIAANTQYPEIVMRWADGTADPDTSYKWNKGPGNYQVINGKYQTGLKDEVGGVANNYAFPVMGITESWFTEHVDLLNQPQDAYKGKINEMCMPYATMMTVEHLRYQSEERKVLEANLPQIIEYSKQKEAEWITKGSIDEEWDKHIQQLKSMNIEEIQKIMQTAADRWNETE